MARRKFFEQEQPAPATRARMRSGILRDIDKAPICECTLYDLEDGNVGIVLPDTEIDIPSKIYVEDRKDLTIAAVQIRWRDGPYLATSYLERPVLLSKALDA